VTDYIDEEDSRDGYLRLDRRTWYVSHRVNQIDVVKDAEDVRDDPWELWFERDTRESWKVRDAWSYQGLRFSNFKDLWSLFASGTILKMPYDMAKHDPNGYRRSMLVPGRQVAFPFTHFPIRRGALSSLAE
jgi:hypothetical protein